MALEATCRLRAARATLYEENGGPVVFISTGDYQTDLHRLLLSTSPRIGGAVPRRLAPIRISDAAASGPDLDGLLQRLSQLVRESASEEDIVSAVSEALGKKTKVRVLKEGSHVVAGGVTVACGKAEVVATGAGCVFALGESQLTARDTVQVFAADNAVLSLYGNVRAFATGDARVKGSYDRVRGRAVGNVEGVARGESIWVTGGRAQFDGFDGSWLYAEDESSVRCYSGNVRVRGNAVATLFGKTIGWFEGRASGELQGESRGYFTPSATLDQVSSESRAVCVEAGTLTCRAWPEW